MNKIAILGSPDTILGFKALGIDTYTVLNLEEAKKILVTIEKENYAILFITEDWIEVLEEKLEEFKSRTLPAVIAIPNQLGTTGYGLKNLKKIVEKAVGSDILFKE